MIHDNRLCVSAGTDKDLGSDFLCSHLHRYDVARVGALTHGLRARTAHWIPLRTP
jgi:hypothetical protein